MYICAYVCQEFWNIDKNIETYFVAKKRTIRNEKKK